MMAEDATQCPSRGVWQGPRVRLRAFEAEDWETYHAWNMDDEQARNLDQIHLPQSAATARQWAEREAARGPDGDNYRFVIENEHGEVVGDLSTHDCDPRVGAFSYGISIRPDQRGKGYASEAIPLVLRYYFQERRYQKATVTIFSFNEPSVRLHERLGFQLEGRIRRTAYTAGAHHDALIYGLTAEEFAAWFAHPEPPHLA
ncbi:MAG: GNAT family protein [Thermomicrobiales bacterium]